MLGRHDAGVTIAVSDLPAARSFYGETLGLEASMEMDDATIYSSGNSRVLVYRSAYAGTNRATVATWSAGDDFDQIVEDLRGKGVGFEHYDLPGTTREGDVHTMEGMRGVWLKDPDGNILSIVDQ
jgi:catechol 2,3-dioxygenase-like lactoylglutathione lyase family enzyme